MVLFADPSLLTTLRGQVPLVYVAYKIPGDFVLPTELSEGGELRIGRYLPEKKVASWFSFVCTAVWYETKVTEDH